MRRRFIGAANAPATGLDPEWFLAQNDSHHFFKRIGDLFVTGPAQTHVMGLRILLVAQVFEMD
ncbi:MAG: MOFRL family protein [Desulfobacterales bacterium]|nr:MOFRL family protein [Desulfobacterales bacterium]